MDGCRGNFRVIPENLSKVEGIPRKNDIVTRRLKNFDTTLTKYMYV